MRRPGFLVRVWWPGFPAPELAHACLRTLSGNLRWLHCGPPRPAGAPQEDSHPVSHTRLSRRVTGPQSKPLTLSLSPRPRPAITRSRSSPSVISPQLASPSDPDSVTLSVAFGPVKIMTSPQPGPLSQGSFTLSRSVLSECDFPARVPSSCDRVRLSVTQSCQSVTSHPASPQPRPSHLASQIQSPQAEAPSPCQSHSPVRM